MTLTAPPGYVDLYKASNRPDTDINVIGVVTDFLPPARSKGTDWVCTFSLADSTLGGHGDGLKVRFFRPLDKELPAVHGIGDVVILRNVKSKLWSGMTLILSGWGSSWTVFHAASIPERIQTAQVQLKYVKETRAPAPTSVEMQYAISLCNTQDRSTFTKAEEPKASISSTAPANSMSSTTIRARQKFSVVKDVVVDNFYDLVGQVVKIWPNNGRTELYISDYTSNALLFNYEWGREGNFGETRDADTYSHLSRLGSKKWPGPFGKMTLMVTLWPPHSSFAESDVKENDFVFLRNTRIKYNSDGRLEGGLHTDRRYSERIDVTILNDHSDDRVKDVLRRKKDYSKRFKQQSEELIAEARGQKRNVEEDSEPLSKNQRRKKRKQQQQEQQKQKQKQKGQSWHVNDEHQSKEEHGGEPLSILKLKNNLNQNSESLASRPPVHQPSSTNTCPSPVHCTHPLIRPRPLSSVLQRDETHATTTPSRIAYTLPFNNICSRATVRAVGFFPPRLEDFAVKHRVNEYDILSDNDEDSESESESSSSKSGAGEDGGDRRKTRWEWRFCLLLEDASPGLPKGERRERIKVYVADQDAEFLLKMDAEEYVYPCRALS